MYGGPNVATFSAAATASAISHGHETPRTVAQTSP